MSIDQISVNSEPTPPPSLPEASIVKKESMRSLGTLILSILAIALSSTTIVLYQKLHTQIQHSTTSVNTQNHQNKDWQSMQTQIQKLGQTQQELSTQMVTNQQHLEQLIQTQPYQTQDWDIQKARYYLDLAQIDAEWSHNSNTTLHLLQHADQILAHSNHPNVQRIRQAIALDITAIMQIPSIDTKGILAKLATINNQIAQLSTQFYPAHASSPNPTTPAEPTPTWRANWDSSMQQLRGLISIRHQDEDALAPLNPDYIALLRENIRMNLQQAELGIIEQREALYTLALQAAINSISFGFNQNNAQTQALIQSLQDLKKITVVFPMPTLHPYSQLFDPSTPNSSSAQTPDLQDPS